MAIVVDVLMEVVSEYTFDACIGQNPHIESTKIGLMRCGRQVGNLIGHIAAIGICAAETIIRRLDDDFLVARYALDAEIIRIEAQADAQRPLLVTRRYRSFAVSQLA